MVDKERDLLLRALARAVEAARAAGRAILKIYNRGFSVEYKSDASPVTEADRLADGMIRSSLEEAFPSIPILSEETADDGTRLASRLVFLADPLDGTRDFVQKNGEFTVNIALIEEGRPVMGVVLLPVTGALYYGAEGFGSFYLPTGEGELFDDSTAIRVSGRLTDLRAVGSRSFFGDADRALHARLGARLASFRQAGSSLKGCLVASGEADLYVRYGPTYEWDMAAAHAVVLGAGGVVRRIDGSPLTYNKLDPLNREGFFMIGNEALAGPILG